MLKPLRFRRVPHPLMARPCIVPTSHVLQQSGYVRIWQRSGDNRRKEGLHRIVYRSRRGPIAPGWEVDHICQRRSCCNPEHLRCLTRADHLKVTNVQRNAERMEEARCYWEAHRHLRNVTGVELGQRFGVSRSCGYRWLREWKAEDAIAT